MPLSPSSRPARRAEAFAPLRRELERLRRQLRCLGLEARLGTRLLARTTRSVATTEAGQSLLAQLAPALGEIDAAMLRVAKAA